ncbi:MAG: hypothetical protein H0X66_11445 [Verrucomicrobia bacterium]|nr:hypothetical protein [Verrucomicrobiota bacterium]
MDEVIPFPSWEYFLFLAIMMFARGADFLSTWVATPNLVLEGNPIAKKMGWKIGLIVNALLCITFAFLPLAAIIISTTSILVAARNFQNAWLMRSLGEEGYRDWYVSRLVAAHLGIYIFCLLAQTALYLLLGGALMYFSRYMIPFAIGLGIIGYAVTVLLYTSLSVWRIRRR